MSNLDEIAASKKSSHGVFKVARMYQKIRTLSTAAFERCNRRSILQGYYVER